jgi:integrase/recombinase XerD
LVGSFRHLDFSLVREQVEAMSARPQIEETLETGSKRKNPREIESVKTEQDSKAGLCVLDEWTSFLISVRGRTEGTARRYRRLIERLLADVGKPIEQLRREDVERHLRRLHVAGRGESVRQGVVVAVRSLGEWCLAHGIMEVNPGSSLSGPRPYRREIKVLTVGEVSRLLWGDKPGTLPRDPLALRDRVLLGVAYVAGLRASEIGPLEAEGVAWQEATQTFSILVRHGKRAGGDVRLPLDRPVSRMLGAWLAARRAGAGRFLWGRPLTRGAVRKILQRRCAEVGIVAGGRRISPHVLRHSLATHLLQKGVDIRKVQLLLRHRSIATTEGYLHADVERLGAVLVRSSPLEQRRRKASPLRPAMAQLLGELQGLVRPDPAGGGPLPGKS